MSPLVEKRRKVGIVIIDGTETRAALCAAPHWDTRQTFRTREHITVMLTANCPGLGITPGNNLGYITLGTQTCLNITALPFPCLKAEMMTMFRAVQF